MPILSFQRRTFIKLLGQASVLFALPVTSCKQLFKKSKADLYQLDEKMLLIQDAVLNHMFPSEGQVPGSTDIGAQNFVLWVHADPNLREMRKKILSNGPRWVDEKSQELYQNDFLELSTEQKEEVLRQVENHRNGEKWLSMLISHSLEAMLGDPLYGGNKEEKGWKWLKLVPGYPRPTIDKIYTYHERV